MAVDLSEVLVVGVTARALFNLEAENDIFEKEGVKKYREYQDKNQDVPLEMGTAFYLVKSLLELNKQAHKPVVEVVVMSRNSPETGIRILKSIEKYELDITRLAFSGGEPRSQGHAGGKCFRDDGSGGSYGIYQMGWYPDDQFSADFASGGGKKYHHNHKKLSLDSDSIRAGIFRSGLGDFL